jgi:protein-S-isoprenylcysteine O-methyltransferase Ste14
MFLFLFGITVMCWGQVTLHHNYAPTVVIKEGHQLVKHGIYRWVRNPMYLGASSRSSLDCPRTR